MSDSTVDCPLCFAPFPAAQIERHAANCTGPSAGAVPAFTTATTATTSAPPPPPQGGQAGSSGAGSGSGGSAALGLVQCPICGGDYPAVAIEHHAELCNGAPGGGTAPVVDAASLSGQCHTRCGRPGNAKYGGYCLTCLNRRGGTASLRPKLVQRQALSGRNVDVCQGDITLESAKAIVNPANSKLDHASGVAGAIARAAGPELFEDGDAILAALPDRRLPTGDAAVTRAGGSLQCRHVIHAVGPTWKGGDKGEPAALASCIRRALEIADNKRLISIAIPAVSSGIFGYPKALCARHVLDAVFAFLNDHPDTSIKTVRLTNVDDATVQEFRTALGAEQRPTCSIVRWVAGDANPEGDSDGANKQTIRVMHGTPYAAQRCASPGQEVVVVVDFCNLAWELITPFIDVDEQRSRLQEGLRVAVKAQGISGPDTAASPVRAFAVRDSETDARVAIAACASNKFDAASYERLVDAIHAAMVIGASTPGATALAVPLVGASTLAFTNTVAARAVVEAAWRLLKRRAELGQPALDVRLCEGPDSAFFVQALRTTFVIPGATTATKSDSGVAVKAEFSEPAALTFTGDASATAAPAAAAPPANETPKQRRERERAEAEARLAARQASENP